MTDQTIPGNDFWRRTFFTDVKPATPLARQKNDITHTHSNKIITGSELWLKNLFHGIAVDHNPSDRLIVLKEGRIVHEIPLSSLGQETLIGRHPSADLQLESFKIAMYHLVIHRKEDSYYVENLDFETGTLLNRKKLSTRTPVLLRDGAQIDLPCYRLEFKIANSPPLPEEIETETAEIEEIPSFFYTPPPPPASPLLANLIEQREQIGVWREGITTLKVVDIIDETHDTKTFRLVGVEPLLFAYRPGQFITLILNLNGEEVRRSYSMSSSPSRPYLLEITVKRVAGGQVSNWLCDHIKLGDQLTAKGPAGKFTCFNYPSSKILFIGAGSGITPIISMCRWIVDTASDVDIKLLASFRSPSDIIFRKELELWAARNHQFKVAITLTSGWQGTDSWTGYTGRVSPELLNVFVPDIHDRHIFLCGPEPFAKSIRKILNAIGYNLSNLHTESFGSGRSAQGSPASLRKLELKGNLHRVTFRQTGMTVDVDEQITLLDLAEAYGIEIEYGCRIGSCGACEVKCQGSVKAGEECEIDPKSRAAGYVYTCCTTAVGDVVLDI